MKVLHMLSAGGTGGIETLCREYTSFSKNDNVYIFLWSGGYNAKKIKDAGAKIYDLNASKKHILKDWKIIKKICIEEKPDIVIAHHADPYLHIFLMLFKKIFPSIRTVAYAHGNAEEMCHAHRNGRHFFKKNIIKQSMNSTDMVIAISESVKNSLTKYFGTSPEHIAVIYNGVDINKYTCSYKTFSNCIKLIYIGRLIKEKGVQVTLKALSLLPPDLNYEFTVIGDGIYKTELEKLCESLGLNDKVTFIGNRHDIPALLSSADIFIHMPVWEEGFGITVVEAMAAGLICIVNDRGAMPEIITDGKDGYIIPRDNYYELAKKIKEITCNGNITDIQHNARNRASDFSIKNFADKLDKELLNA